MIFRPVFSGWTGRVAVLTLAALMFNGCSPREQTRAKRWKAQADAFLQDKEAPADSDWPIKTSEEEEDEVVRQPVTFPELVGSLPHPQSWPQLQSGMVLRFLAAQGRGDWRAEIQNRLLHLFFIYLNDSERYSAKRWDKAVERLNNRLTAIDAKLPEGSEDRRMIAQVRAQLEQADAEAKKRFGREDGSGEVMAFQEELKKLQAVDRNELAARVGGESQLSSLEKIHDGVIAEVARLWVKYQPRKSPANEQAYYKEVGAVHARSRKVGNYSKYMQDPEVRSYVERPEAGGRSVRVPDLVTILGENKAKDLLTQALRLPVRLSIPLGDATKKLAAQLALEQADQLQAPQWELAWSIQGVDLFEALQKRFPAKSISMGGDSNRRRAEVYYLFGLIARDRADEALAWADKVYPSLERGGEISAPWTMPYQLLEQMEKAGYGEQVWTFMAKLLDKYPDLPFWDGFINLSSRLKKNAPMLELVERTSQRPGLKEDARWKMRKSLAKAYLAVDRVEEGVAILRATLTQTSAVPALQKDRYEAGLQLAQLGQLLQRADWIAEGLAAAENYVVNLKPESFNYDGAIGLVDFYQKLGRNDDAERVISGELQKWTAAREADEVDKTPGQSRSARRSILRNGEKKFLEALLALYTNLGRNEDAIRLLTKNPNWGGSDLAEFLKDSAGYPPYPMGYWASWALARLGRGEEALAVAKGQIRVKPGSDGAYAILTQLQQKEALPFLDKIYRIDQFEERPLIWKARLLLEAGELDEAEQAAKAAIAVDPSDGEQGKGDRMRVYAIMGEIEKKRGNKEKELFFENVIRSIRLSEDADDFSRAGLNTRAIAMYQEALGFFSDAYCIQSRLARKLVQENREEEALPHYQKAYELMPDSFGRVESHCFGCEKAFAGEKAQGVAEKVFLAFLKKNPTKPQVHYLLGYLREEQQRYGEALQYYQQAVALDPLYLNAWKHIEGLKDKIRIDPRILDRVQLRLLVLDPSGQHSSLQLSTVNDLPKLWGHLALSDRVLNTVPVPEAVFELTASEEALRQKGKNQESSSNHGDERTFAKILLQHDAIRSLQEALEMTRREEEPAQEIGEGMEQEQVLE